MTTKEERLVHVALGTIPFGTKIITPGKVRRWVVYRNGKWNRPNPNDTTPLLHTQEVLNNCYIDKGTTEE